MSILVWRTSFYFYGALFKSTLKEVLKAVKWLGFEAADTESKRRSWGAAAYIKGETATEQHLEGITFYGFLTLIILTSGDNFRPSAFNQLVDLAQKNLSQTTAAASVNQCILSNFLSFSKSVHASQQCSIFHDEMSKIKQSFIDEWDSLSRIALV